MKDFEKIHSGSVGSTGRALTRRRFIQSAALAVAALRLPSQTRAAGAGGGVPPFPEVPIIDIHLHCTHRGRPDEMMLVHQKNTGARTTIILPAGETGGLAAGAAGNEHVIAFARKHPEIFVYFTNENAFRQNAPQVISRYLKNEGAIGIGELKDAVSCDSRDMERIAEVAREFDVPMLIHFQDGTYNDGFARFHRMLEKFPTVKFIGHAQTMWANVDKNYVSSMGLSPSGPVTPGGLTDRWLADYPNFFGDISAGSGNRALSRDPDFTTGFLTRHQDKLLYGSDCRCETGVGPACLGATKLSLLRQLAESDEILHKILHKNSRRIFRLPAQHRV